MLDVQVVELFDVSIRQVRYLRKKYNVNTKRVFQHLREAADVKSKARLFSPENADALAIALSHYIYREGPIEDGKSMGMDCEGGSGLLVAWVGKSQKIAAGGTLSVCAHFCAH